MVNVLCDNVTNRTVYTLNFIFNDVLRCNYKIIAEPIFTADIPVICYGTKSVEGAYHIFSTGLLSESSIRNIETFAKGEGINTILFPSDAADHPFDVFSAVFYLLSRYEEYLPFSDDIYKRFPHTSSIAFRLGFLHYPLINKWINDLALHIQKRFPALKKPERTFFHLATYDIDLPWAFRNKGFFRNLGGWMRSPGIERIKVLLNLTPDPFYSFEFLEALHTKHNIQPAFFWLLAQNRGEYDKNVSPANKEMKQLIKEHSSRLNGLHPSWKSHDRPDILLQEKQVLEDLLGKKITASRQHYLRFRLPETYEILLRSGITDEYSMGYGTVNGFRASTSTPFYWFNLFANEETRLKVHPFCFMDANSFYEQRQSAEISFNELMHYYNVCKHEGGTFITIFHNNFLGTHKRFSGWKEMYERFIQEVHS